MFLEVLVSVPYCHFMYPNSCSTYKLDTDIQDPNIHDVLLVTVITYIVAQLYLNCTTFLD